MAIEAGDYVYLSGQTPMDPATGKLVQADIGAETRQCLENLKAVLDAGGLTFANVVKSNVFLTSMGDFAAMNEVYRTYFPEPYPARSTVAVAALPLGARVEIELIAYKGK
jgi:2-iminobutanoate/2-iminopropanoate deaminase